MNNKIITSLTKQYWPYGLICIWAVACWTFFQFCYPYHFFYKEQNQLFLWTADYLQTYSGPGWLARMAGDFLTQFYFYLFAGSVILTIVLLLLGDIIRRTFHNFGFGKWAFLIGILAMTLEAWRHFHYGYSLSSTISLIGYALALWLCSLVFKKRKKLSFILMLMAMLPCWLLFGKPQAGKFIGPEWELEKLLAVDNEYYWGHYTKVKQLVENDTNRSPYAVFLYNLAQAQKGQLPDNLLKVTPIEMGTLWKIGPEAPLLETKMINELYYVLGDVTYAERAAMMGNVFAPDNRNVRMIKRLAECNLISGDQPAADKYLRILKNTFAYRNWAELAPTLPVYKEKAQFINKKDTIRLGDFARTILLELLDSNPQNIAALDYLLCTDLTTGDIGSFKSDYDRYCMNRNAPRIKPLYQQALLIYMAGTQAPSEELFRYVTDTKQLSDFNEYNKVRGTAMTSKYHDTYWYYFDKNFQNKKQ